MDGSTEGYLVFVVLGILLVVAVGQLLTRAGRVYLEEVFPERRTAGSVSILLSVMFYLFALGILGVISSMEVPVEGVPQTVVTKLGVVLLILGVVFGATMLVLSRIRARREENDKQEALIHGLPGNQPDPMAPLASPAEQPVATPAHEATVVEPRTATR